MTKAEATTLLNAIIKSIEEKKGKGLISLDFKNIENAVCEYFIICSGTSKVHVEAIADFIIENVKKKTKTAPWHKEGFENAEWILIDYANIIVHVFQEETRKFYKLENLWADADIKHYKEEE
ncbi:MAG: ribosome silencing factor [Bacteroidales bacterium]|nr:ribosome silencing factor [Bacteroidales bacterium]